MTALDTSVAGKLLITGPGSEAVRALFRSGAPLRGSSLLIVELLRMATREGLGPASAERVLARVEMLTVDDTIYRQAGRLTTPGTWVRTADAIHLVCALRLGERKFLTYDRVQARGAESLGLQVSSPGMADGWWRQAADRPEA